MLDGLRSFTSTLVGKIFFGVVALSFVAFGGFTALGGLSLGDVSKVGSRTVSPTDFVREINNYQAQFQQATNRPLTLEQTVQFGLHLQALDDLERRAAMNALSDDLNLGLSQEQLIERMRNDPALGGPTTPALFASNLRDIIASGGFTENTFQQFYLDGTVRDQIQQSLTSDLILPEVGRETVLKALRNQRSVDYVRINRLNIDAVVQPTEEDISAYLTENQSQLQRPTLRSFDIITLSPQLLAASLEVTEEQLAQEFEANKAQYPDAAEQRSIKQVILEDASILTQFREGLAQGKNFDTLVEELDLGASLRNFGTVTATEILDETVRDLAFGAQLDVPAFSTNAQNTSIVLVDAINPARPQTLHDVREQVKNTLSLRLANAQINDMRDQIDNEIASGKELAEIGADNKLTSAQFTLDAQGNDLDGNSPLEQGDVGPIMEMVFGAPLNSPSPSVSGAGASTYWIKVTQIEEQRDLTLAEARDTIVERLTQEREQAALETLAQSLVDDIKAGKTVAELAEEKNYLAITSALFARDARSVELGAAVVQKAFEGDTNLADWAEAGDGDIIVFKVAEEVAVETGPSDDDIQTQLATSLNNDVIDLFASALRDDYGASRNESAIQAVLTPQPHGGGHTGM